MLTPNKIWPGYAHDFLTTYPDAVVGWMLCITIVVGWLLFKDNFFDGD